MKRAATELGVRVSFTSEDAAAFRARHPRSQVHGAGWFEFEEGEGDLVDVGGAARGQDGPAWVEFMRECRDVAFAPSASRSRISSQRAPARRSPPPPARPRSNPPRRQAPLRNERTVRQHRRTRTFASLFSGGGGWELGALRAGLKPRWSVEIEPQIAAVLDENLARHGVTGHTTHVASVLDVDPHALEEVDVLCASPVCKSVSQARMREGLAPREDAEIGRAVVGYLDVLKPPVLLVENAPLYREHPAFLAIVRAAERLGYVWDFRVVSADHYGVPQSRKRLIARFFRDGFVAPWPPFAQPVSWLDAIGDLIPTFPVQALAPWQQTRIQRMKARGVPMRFPVLVSSSNAHTPAFDAGKTVVVSRDADAPSWTIVASYGAMSQTRVLYPNGRVLGLTPRAFARLQSFPDSYALPSSARLATTIVGNAVPPRLAEALLREVTR